MCRSYTNRAEYISSRARDHTCITRTYGPSGDSNINFRYSHIRLVVAYLHVSNMSEIPGLVQAVKSPGFQKLTHDLVCDLNTNRNAFTLYASTESNKSVLYLVAPFVYNGHVDVVNEDCHLLASRRAVSGSHPFFDVAFNRALNVHTTVTFETANFVRFQKPGTASEWSRSRNSCFSTDVRPDSFPPGSSLR